MAKNLVIVESPAKAKTIEKFLGKDFVVMSSFGHIRDLPSKDMSIDLENNFEPNYIITEDKVKVVKELKAAVEKAEFVWLASDEDREGEAIAWHLKEALNLDKTKTKRIVFNEITKNAILKAVENPRDIDLNLVNAQQARRVLDRIVGYEISPVLWKKVKPSLSAGRVQSVAVRLIVEREKEINNFKENKTYKVVADFQTTKQALISATLNQRFETKEQALEFLKESSSADFTVQAVETKPSKQSPAAPFTTSTLQQEASRKLGFPVARTMQVAQQLYEAGYITYMRTDSVNLSDLALSQAKELILKEYGEEYFKSRKYSNKIKGAQEAHEAIRPTVLSNTEVNLDSSAQRLYDLIRKRTIASQMADAKLEKTNITINISNRQEKYLCQGEVILFDGFMKVYQHTANDEEETENTNQKLLPAVNQGEKLQHLTTTATETFNNHPPRYNEASLVKKLEDLGIGRPSTYAPTISTIQKREYVIKMDKPASVREIEIIISQNNSIKQISKKENYGAEKSKLNPTDIGTIVTDFLSQHFTDVIDYNFTAEAEKEFDSIAQGKEDWKNMIRDFYTPFHNEVLASEKTERPSGERLLGVEPQSGKNVYARIGKYGSMIQIGESTDKEKPRFASLTKEQSINTITLEEALNLFKLPRVVGQYNGMDIIANTSRFGHYISHNKVNASLPKTSSPMTISLEECIALLEEKNKKGQPIKTFANGAELLNGIYGAYIKYNGNNYKIPKTMTAESIDEKALEEIINQEPTNKKGKKK
ncbi:MAG: type I DNA topoisomerase [Bacteroidales bacterium]|nr:type I DNA topoisomerase [Bacteroidales bacterium]